VNLLSADGYARKLHEFRIADESGKPLEIPVGGMVNLAEQF